MICRVCGQEKAIDEFAPDNRKKLGVDTRCKSCTAEYKRIYQQKNKEQISLQKKLYREQNTDKILDAKRMYYEKNKESINARNKEYYILNKQKYLLMCKEYRERNKERKKLTDKEYYERNKEKISEYKKNYALLNKDRIRLWMLEWNRKARLTNINYKLYHSCNRRINRALKRTDKLERTFELVGCTIAELKTYLESKFTDGMTWENYGKNGWHIDHIRPCASFDLLDIEQRKECFHYTNLQPLWARDNIVKSSYWNGIRYRRLD